MEKIVLHIENIKSHAKQIEKASAFKVKHLQMLNQISETLGFTNYQILKGVSNENNKYFEVSIDNIKNSFVYERLLLLDSIKDQCLQASPIETLDAQNEQYFLNLKDKMLNIVIDSLKTFSFLDLNIEKILNNHMSFDSIIYYLFLAIKFKKQEIEKNILDYFDCDNILLIKTEFNTGKHPIYNFEDFLKKFTHLLDDSNLKQKHAYAHQQWHPINNRAKEYFKERLGNGQSFLYIDPKSKNNSTNKMVINENFEKLTLEDLENKIYKYSNLLYSKFSKYDKNFPVTPLNILYIVMRFACVSLNSTCSDLRKYYSIIEINKKQREEINLFEKYLDMKTNNWINATFISLEDYVEFYIKLENFNINIMPQAKELKDYIHNNNKEDFFRKLSYCNGKTPSKKLLESPFMKYFEIDNGKLKVKEIK